MLNNSNPIIKQATCLSPFDRLVLVDLILESLDMPDSKLEKLRADETENRWKAYKSGEIKSVPAAEVFEKYEP